MTDLERLEVLNRWTRYAMRKLRVIQAAAVSLGLVAIAGVMLADRLSD